MDKTVLSVIIRLNFILAVTLVTVLSLAAQARSPYPHSQLITGITFHFTTIKSAARESDIWPVTWASDGKIYTAWGDGNGFSGPDKVSWGLATLEGGPADWKGRDIFYGLPGSGKGKISGLLALGDTLYGWENMQNHPYPFVDLRLIRSTDHGRSWDSTGVLFGAGRFKPVSFVNFGAGYTHSRDGFVYIAGFDPTDTLHDVFLARAPRQRLTAPRAYQYYRGIDASGHARWDTDSSRMVPVFSDAGGGNYFPVIVFNRGLGRYLLTDCHGVAGAWGVFEGPEPWGPWKTVYYGDHWGGLTRGIYLGYEFPNKWASADGRQLTMIFSVYDSNIAAWNDACNSMQVTLITHGKRGPEGRRP